MPAIPGQVKAKNGLSTLIIAGDTMAFIHQGQNPVQWHAAVCGGMRQLQVLGAEDCMLGLQGLRGGMGYPFSTTSEPHLRQLQQPPNCQHTLVPMVHLVPMAPQHTPTTLVQCHSECHGGKGRTVATHCWHDPPLHCLWVGFG